MADQDDDRLSRPMPSDAAELQDRSVVGGSPLGGGSSQVSSGAFDTVGGGDLGGEGTRAPGYRDPGDAAGDLRPESAEVDTDGRREMADLARQEAEQLAQRVFGDAGNSGGAAGRKLGGPAGDDAGSGVAGLGGLVTGQRTDGAGGLDARNLGGGGTGFGQTAGVQRQGQTFGLGGTQPQQDPDAGGANPLQDQLRAHGAAQERQDASDAQGLLDGTRAQSAVSGSDPNNDNL